MIMYAEKFTIYKRQFGALWDVFRANSLGMIGLIVLATFVIMALIGNFFTPYETAGVGTFAEILNPPSWAHPFGTDDVGRDVLSQVLKGAGVSLLVGMLAATISLAVGATIGLLSGYYRGILGIVLVRFTDIFLIIPASINHNTSCSARLKHLECYLRYRNSWLARNRQNCPFTNVGDTRTTLHSASPFLRCVRASHNIAPRLARYSAATFR